MGISVKDLSFSYGTTMVLHNIELNAAEGKFTVLLGKNGSGKSTLLKLMAGLLPCKTGDINIMGKDIRHLSISERAKVIGYLPQFHTAAFPFTVEEVVLTGRASYVFAVPGKKDMDITNEAINKVGISHLRQRPYTELSGGERQLVMIARVLAQEPQVILLDEPLSHLDLSNQIRFLALIKELIMSGLTVVAVLHDPNIAFMYADDFMLIKDGTIRILSGDERPWDASILTDLYGVHLETMPFRERALVIPG
ncbi:MAG: ABC transporter ATP-binding protein [Nitrospira sp.]|nr:ABC transporter ATP-binding protein [Nitrospira sp.]